MNCHLPPFLRLELTILKLLAVLPSAYRKLAIKGVAGLALSPAPSGPALAKLCAFVPEAKGSPASAGVYDWSAEQAGS